MVQHLLLNQKHFFPCIDTYHITMNINIFVIVFYYLYIFIYLFNIQLLYNSHLQITFFTFKYCFFVQKKKHANVYSVHCIKNFMDPSS